MAAIRTSIQTKILAALIAAVAVMLLLLRHMVVIRVEAMRAAMQRIEAESDLSHRLKVDGVDEIARLSRALNSMLERFGSSLREVLDTTASLKAVAA